MLFQREIASVMMPFRHRETLDTGSLYEICQVSTSDGAYLIVIYFLKMEFIDAFHITIKIVRDCLSSYY
ncbi:hypothetical protein C9E25_08340 [Escherichia coli]|nr:hypothetical protein CR540_24305 [Escherichia coli]AUK13653.1 hypothetical protein CR536_25040 [Escherichia coli]EFO1828516.1 hypothetical protein [Escherichia coli]EFO4097178.1 hypothetical protein [Escherichia coli]PSZ59719.1 hypothetical protein C9E30_21785 [Escherichia coli]